MPSRASNDVGHRRAGAGCVGSGSDAGEHLGDGARFAIGDHEWVTVHSVDMGPLHGRRDRITGVVDVRRVNQGGATPDDHQSTCPRAIDNARGQL